MSVLKGESDAQAAPIPRDARLVALILASMGIDDAEPAALVQLLEFANRASRGEARLTAGYTTQVLQDALVYADHAAHRQGGSSVSLDDVQLAIQSRVNYSFSQPPPKDVRSPPARVVLTRRCYYRSRRRSTASHYRPFQAGMACVCRRRSTASRM